MPIQKDIEELLEEQVISQETAKKIELFYAQRQSRSQHRIISIFGILGALLVGLGIVLIIAHNWDDLSRGVQTVLAFIPLLVGQSLVVLSKWKKSASTAWVEGSAIFLFFSIGACISMVSQIYHVSGNLGDYLMLWMLLALPIVYLLPSAIVAIFYLIGITYMGAEVGYFNPRVYSGINKYWIMLLALAPFYYWMQKHRNSSNFLNFLNWLIPLSLVVCLGVFAERNEEWLLLAYMSLFGMLYNSGSYELWFKQSIVTNGFKFIGSVGTVFILLMSSFRSFWKEFDMQQDALASGEFYIFVLLAVLALVWAVFNAYRLRKFKPKHWIFLLFIPLFFWGLHSTWVVVLVNIIVLAIGIQTIRQGAEREHLGLLNYGLLIIAALVSCRFFDANLSFVLRGLLFIVLGLAFFLGNYWMLKNKKA